MFDRESIKLLTEQAAREGLAFCPYDAWVRRTLALLGMG